MSPDSEYQDSEKNNGGTDDSLAPNVLPNLFRTHANAVDCAVDTFAAEIERDGKPTASQLDSVRTELRELEAAIENHGAELCDDADSWERVDEQIPTRQ